jgi:acetyl esterase/lipase
MGYVAWGIKADDPDHTFRFTDVLGPWIMPYVAKAPQLYFDQWWATLLLAHWNGTYPAGAPMDPQASDVVVSGWESDPAVQRFFADATVGQRHATGAILVLQGTKDLLYKQYPALMAQLRAAGDDVRGRVLPGQSHDMAVTYGWPWAKAFLRAHLPAR